MAISRIFSTFAIGASMALLSLPAKAQAPAVYYAWRSIEGDIAACLNRSTAALQNQNLGNIQSQGNSVAGTSDIATAVFICFDNAIDTTVMIVVSSNDDDTAFNLREGLKSAF